MARALALAVGGLLAFAAAAVWLLGSWFPGGSLRRRPRVSRTSMTLWRVLALNLLVTVSACTAGGSGEHLATTTPIRSRVVPRAPLSQAACVAEMRGWSFSLSQARPVCASARTFPWFHASITNQSAPATYVRCAFTAWDKNDHQLFFGRLPPLRDRIPRWHAPRPAPDAQHRLVLRRGILPPNRPTTHRHCPLHRLLHALEEPADLIRPEAAFARPACAANHCCDSASNRYVADSAAWICLPVDIAGVRPSGGRL